MKTLTVVVGPPGSGKSTFSIRYAKETGASYINQDSQKKGHLGLFLDAIEKGDSIIVDRMNFDKSQRNRYIKPAREAGYYVIIKVIHEPRKVCFDRMLKRENHETIKNKSDANSALNLFFSKYERPTQDEADQVDFIYSQGEKDLAVICDLDGTICDLKDRLRHVRKPQGEKKNWKAFFEELENDQPHDWCKAIIDSMDNRYPIVFASGRPDDYENKTRVWLEKYGLPTTHLYMRCRGDHRQDFIAKEIILDFEILTRFKPFFFIDDRKQVVDFWRSRGYTCLSCADGDF